MRYMFLIYDVETEQNERAAELMPAYGAFTQEVTSSGIMRGADRLHPTGSATSVRVRDGNPLTTDGPFAETKEQLGGFYILECKDLDDALAYAAKIPSARFGTIEVRPIMEMP